MVLLADTPSETAHLRLRRMLIDGAKIKMKYKDGIYHLTVKFMERKYKAKADTSIEAINQASVFVRKYKG